MLEYKYVPEIEGVEGHGVLRFHLQKERLVLVKSAGISGKTLVLMRSLRSWILLKSTLKKLRSKGDVECDS